MACAPGELIREALYPYPSGLAIVSKVAARRDHTGAVLPYDEPHQLRRGIEDNLTSLGTDRLAAVNLRLADGSVPDQRFAAQLAAMIQARDEGLIDGIGLSNITPDHLHRATAITEIVCVQNLFNLADRRSLGVLRECHRRDIAFVPFARSVGHVKNAIGSSSTPASPPSPPATELPQHKLPWLGCWPWPRTSS